MAYKDLHSYIRALKAAGELKCIDASVSPDLEITEIADRVSKTNGPALLFKHAEGSDYPVLINAMGSFKRMSMALGVEDLDDIGSEISKYLELLRDLSVQKLIKSVPLLLRLLTVFPARRKFRGQCQQVIEKDVDLGALPVLKCWPGDAGRFITLPLVFTRHLRTKQQNVGMYRMQILDRTTTGMHWHKHKDGSGIYRDYQEQKLKMPVSVALGCDPALTYAATAPLPGMIDEIMLAGWLRKSRVKMVKSITNDIYIPANAEFVLEGYVDPAEEPVLEGPFGDHTGYYSLADYYPRFHVTCVTHRKNAVYPATVVGKPPMEDCYMAKATERIFLPLLKLQIPELADLNLPPEGVFHNCAIVSVHNRYPGCARKVMNSIWGTGQMMYTKLIVAVDEKVDVQNLSEVYDAVLKHVRGPESLILSEGPLDALDHSSDKALFGSRLGIDATENGAESQKDGSDSCRILFVRKDRPGQGREAVLEALKQGSDRFTVAVDEWEPKNMPTILWRIFNNIDAGRDLVLLGNRIGLDATKKWKEEGLTRDWPDDITMSDEIKKRVDERWDEYGID